MTFQDSRAAYIGQPPSINLGRYSVPFRITTSGQYSLSVIQAQSGGLNGIYYQGPNFTQPIFSRIDEQVFCAVKFTSIFYLLTSAPCAGGF
jgi:hypothetical protein